MVTDQRYIEKSIQRLEDEGAIKDVRYPGWNGITIPPNELSAVFVEQAIRESFLMNLCEVDLVKTIKRLKKPTDIFFDAH